MTEEHKGDWILDKPKATTEDDRLKRMQIKQAALNAALASARDGASPAEIIEIADRFLEWIEKDA